MRKVLISILIIVLIILAYFIVFQGVSIGQFKILGTKQISELSITLKQKADEANYKVAQELPNKKQEVLTSVGTLLANKENYFRVANISTETELSEATIEESYNAEYLYLKIGGYARQEGVKMRMDIMATDNEDSEIKNLAFTVTGKYVGIIDFISALENDNELDFVINSFKMIPSEENDGNLKATFNVNGVKIKLDETSQTNNDSMENVMDNMLEENMLED